VKKIKVLRIINRFNIGGPTYNATFLTRFIGDKYETLLVGGMPEEGESDSLHILDNYGLKPILIEEMRRKPSLISDRAAYKKIKEIIIEFKPDIVHTHASKAGALGRKAAFSCGVPIVIHTFHGHVFHSYFGKLKTLLYKNIERNLAKKSTAIVAISEIQKQELAIEHKICDSKKIRVVNLGFDLDQFHQKAIDCRKEVRMGLGLTDEIAIGIIGRLVPIKDHNFFLSVIEQVVQKTKRKFKVFIVGDGSERETINIRVNKLNETYPELIKMCSWEKDIARFNAGLDIICLTSKNEGTPVSLIEAQAANIPVISTDVGGVQDILKDGETGVIVPRGDLNLYVNALVELINNEEKRKMMSQNGWNYVQEKFHYNTLVQNMDRLYSDLLKERE
jgi:glycosyltransferase involved in cell wall biosynthesis